MVEDCCCWRKYIFFNIDIVRPQELFRGGGEGERQKQLKMENKMEKQNKVQLPFRTKIAAVIVFCVSLVVVSFLLLFILSIRNNYPVTQCPSGNLCDNIDYRQLSRYFAPMFLIIPFAGLLLFGAMGLFFLKKIGWWCGVLSVLLFDISYVFVMLVMFMSIENSIMIFILPLALTFIAFLLLITDRKNYFAALEKAKGGGGLTK